MYVSINPTIYTCILGVTPRALPSLPTWMIITYLFEYRYRIKIYIDILISVNVIFSTWYLTYIRHAGADPGMLKGGSKHTMRVARRRVRVWEGVARPLTTLVHVVLHQGGGVLPTLNPRISRGCPRVVRRYKCTLVPMLVLVYLFGGV